MKNGRKKTKISDMCGQCSSKKELEKQDMQKGIIITTNTKGMFERIMVKKVAMRGGTCANSRII